MDYSLFPLVSLAPPPQFLYMLLVGLNEARKHKCAPNSLHIFTLVLNIDKIRAYSMIMKYS